MLIYKLNRNFHVHLHVHHNVRDIKFTFRYKRQWRGQSFNIGLPCVNLFEQCQLSSKIRHVKLIKRTGIIWTRNKAFLAIACNLFLWFTFHSSVKVKIENRSHRLDTLEQSAGESRLHLSSRLHTRGHVRRVQIAVLSYVSHSVI